MPGGVSRALRFHTKNLHATVLRQMGLDPNTLTYFYGGLDQKPSASRAPGRSSRSS